jgi:hypothetical protein
VIVAVVERHTGEIALVAALTAELHEVVDVVSHLLATKEPAHDYVAVALVVCGVAVQVIV